MKELFVAIILFVCILIIITNTFTPEHDHLLRYYGVYDSKIHGKGCFAKQNLPAYFDLGIISVHSAKGMIKIKDPSREGRFYVTKDNMPWREHRLLGRYLNHSDHANCEIYNSSPLTLGLRTRMSIKNGDELTADYFPLREKYMNSDMSDVTDKRYL